VLEGLHGEGEGSLDAGEEVLDLLAAGVDRDVVVAEAGVDEAAQGLGVGDLRSVGDHPDVESALDGVAGDLRDEGREGGFAAGQDDAEVAAAGEVVDL